MPIYEFLCRPCGEVFEVLFRSPFEKRKVRCPKCGGDEVGRVFSTFSTGGGGGGGGCASCTASSCKGCR